MKIAFITTCQDLIPRWQLEIKALQADGFDVMVVCLDRLCSRPARENINGVDIIRIQPCDKEPRETISRQTIALWGIHKDGLIKRFRRITALYAAFIKTFRQNPVDIIHCCHPILLPVAWYLRKTKQLKVVYEVSEFYVDQFFLRLPSFLRLFEKAVICVENYFVSRVDGVVCYPSINGVLYHRYSSNNKNVRVVSNVPELCENIDEQLYGSLREKYQCRKIIIYAGSIKINAGIQEVLESLKTVCHKHPEVKLLLVGSGYNDDSDVFRAYAEKNGLSDNVDIIAFQSYAKLFTYYRSAVIGLATFDKKYTALFTKGNSRKVMEYMKAGLPIIGASYGEATLILKEEQCGLSISEWCSNNIAVALNNILDNPSEAAEMGKRGHRAFVREYNWDIEKKKLLEVYRKLSPNRLEVHSTR